MRQQEENSSNKVASLRHRVRVRRGHAESPAESFYWIGCYIERAEATTGYRRNTTSCSLRTPVLFQTDGCRALPDALSRVRANRIR